MPELNFVLPHWLYWAGLAVFPVVAWLLVQRARRRGTELHRSNLGVGYLCLITSGFVGMHRFYVKSWLGVLYIIPFLAIIVANTESRDARDLISQFNNEVSNYEFKIEHYTKRIGQGYDDQAKLEEAEQSLAQAKEDYVVAQGSHGLWEQIALWSAIVIVIGLAIDALLLPGMIRRIRAGEPDYKPDAIDKASAQKEIDISEEPAFYRAAGAISKVSGEFVAYWSVIAVFVYYYEVIARYIFNSPTNWAHESMFLMFGMQYLLSGAYAYLTESHVRVDVFYAKLSLKGRAVADVLTSIFFFIFAGTILVTGIIFTLDAYRVAEFSFAEWQIVYWPIKATIALGALLLLLQGAAKLLRDFMILGGYTPPAAQEG